MSGVTGRDLQVRLGRTQILHQVDFEAAPGEVTAIVGPNGCGKTTLLRALTAEVPYIGAVTLGGADIATMSIQALAERRAVLPQATNLAFPFTVIEVVRIGLTAGLPTEDLGDAHAIPHDALALVGLNGFEGRFYQELSGGEKQRVQLARVLVQVWAPVMRGQARWLFLDEPVSALDIAHQLEVIDIARRFAEAGGGVVAVMHDLNLTAMFADKVTLMNSGRVLTAGTPSEVLQDHHLSAAYSCDVRTRTKPEEGMAWVLPQAAKGHI